MSRARFVLLYALAWTPLAALYAVVLGSRAEIDFVSAMFGAGWTIGSAAILGGVAWWLSNRLPYDRAHRARFILTHALLSFVYSGLLTGEVAVSIRYNASPASYER